MPGTEPRPSSEGRLSGDGDGAGVPKRGCGLEGWLFTTKPVTLE